MKFGEKLKELREDFEPKLTQTELGLNCGITQRKISYIEMGKTEPSLEDIKRICEFFKVSADYMLDIEKGLKYPKR